jgi:hypothetical protein
LESWSPHNQFRGIDRAAVWTPVWGFDHVSTSDTSCPAGSSVSAPQPASPVDFPGCCSGRSDDFLPAAAWVARWRWTLTPAHAAIRSHMTGIAIAIHVSERSNFELPGSAPEAPHNSGNPESSDFQSSIVLHRVQIVRGNVSGMTAARGRRLPGGSARPR